MRRIYIVYFSAIILMITQTSGCLENSSNKHSYEFEIELEPNNSSKFEVYVPLLINIDNNEISPLMDDLTVKGNATYEIIETIHGDALRIIGNNKITIRIAGTKKIPYAWLNMNEGPPQGPGQDYCVYGNTSSNFTIHIKESSIIEHNKGSNDWMAKDSGFNGDIQNGWQLLNGYRGTAVT